MRYIALDMGDKRIRVTVSDPFNTKFKDCFIFRREFELIE